MKHLSVLKEDVQKFLKLNAGDRVVDATLGLGGHSQDILKKIGKDGILYAFEQDERNLKEAQKNLKEFEKQIVYIHDNFRYLKARITGKVDAILFDLGLSSPHVDDPERGFSFMKEGPLDMRFDTRGDLTAADVLNTYSEEELTKIFFQYGEEKMSRRIARKIVDERKKENFRTTRQLAELLERTLGSFQYKHPATRVFQALRIEVNDELAVLKEALEGAFEKLEIGGRLVVISYHSLEDRIVKNFMKDLEKPLEETIYSKYGDPYIEILTKKPVTPSEEELESNPRSRSAKLRACKKIKEI